MLLHQEFIKIAKQYPDKLAIIDRSTEKSVTYSKALIASLILAGKFRKYHDGFIGVMIPTSAGCMLSILGVLMAGKVPVMINYSTGAANNAEYAQKKCGFKTIIASKALLEKIGCRMVSGMVFIEDIMEELRAADKVKALLKSKLPLGILLKSIHQGEPDDNLVILFTSGSEKDPKAVQLTHRNIGSNVMDIAKVLTAAALRHDRCFIREPPGIQEGLHHRTRGKSFADGRHAQFFFRLPAPIGSG
jgi:acyl-[acyl-carrier-protein]-phospholipid O-acyltransferase/long-chain-fatty-acid--[acyl-carrier-protein] ligase